MELTRNRRRVGVATVAVLALLLTTGASALAAGSSSYGDAPASFFYDDGEHFVFAGPDFTGSCAQVFDQDAHFVETGAGAVHTQGRRDITYDNGESVRVYEKSRYAQYADAFPGPDGGYTPLDVLFSICFGGVDDQPLMVGEGTVWLNNTNCDPGPNGCYLPGSSWTGKNRLQATVHDADGEAYSVKAFVRVEVDLTGASSPPETVLDMRVSIR